MNIRIIAAIAIAAVLVTGGAHVSVSEGRYPATAPQAAIRVWWPEDQARLSGGQVFKAQVVDMDVSAYHMFWQVDDGQWNWMHEEYTDWPHREAAVNVSGWDWNPAGTYTLRFIATSPSGEVWDTKTVPIRVGSGRIAEAHGVVAAPVRTAAAAPAAVVRTSLYVSGAAAVQERMQQLAGSRPEDARRLSAVLSQPVARWFGGWNGDIRADVEAYVSAAAAAGAEPVLVAYNIPQRDCGGWSAGGSSDYPAWIRAFASGIGGKSAIVVLEPDALAALPCLSAADQRTRLDHVRTAVDALAGLPGVQLYVDAGHPGWVSPADMAQRLRAVGIERTAGFALNVSNFTSTAENIAYGKQLSDLLGGAHFVVDTSRNGAGASGEWCNPSGRALGQTPTRFTGEAVVDAFLWVKNPTESDGACNGGPAAGVYFEDRVLEMARNAGM